MSLLLLLGRIANNDAGYCYKQSSAVCRSVFLSVTTVSPAKTAEPIEMSFGVWNRVGPETMY